LLPTALRPQREELTAALMQASQRQLTLLLLLLLLLPLCAEQTISS
jgi:hypothetical protein